MPRVGAGMVMVSRRCAAWGGTAVRLKAWCVLMGARSCRHRERIRRSRRHRDWFVSDDDRCGAVVAHHIGQGIPVAAEVFVIGRPLLRLPLPGHAQFEYALIEREAVAVSL